MHLVIMSVIFPLVKRNSGFVSLTVQGTIRLLAKEREREKKKWYSYDLQTTFKMLNSGTGFLFLCSNHSPYTQYYLSTNAFIYMLNIEEREREREKP